MWYISAITIALSALLYLFKDKINRKQTWWIEILAFSAIAFVYGIKIVF